MRTFKIWLAWKCSDHTHLQYLNQIHPHCWDKSQPSSRKANDSGALHSGCRETPHRFHCVGPGPSHCEQYYEQYCSYLVEKQEMRLWAKFPAECKRWGYFRKCYHFMTQCTCEAWERPAISQLVFVLQSSTQIHRCEMVFWGYLFKTFNLCVCMYACMWVLLHTCGGLEMIDLRSSSELVRSNSLYLHVPAYSTL